MRKMLAMLALLFLASGAAAEDLAGWDKTTWNMSKEELTSLYKDRIKETRDNAGIDERMMLGSITAGDRSFDVELVLEKGRLVLVRLKARVSGTPKWDYNGIRDLLIQKYGHPNTKESKSKAFDKEHSVFHKSAKWFKGATTITLTVTNEFAVILYAPSKNLGGL